MMKMHSRKLAGIRLCGVVIGSLALVLTPTPAMAASGPVLASPATGKSIGADRVMNRTSERIPVDRAAVSAAEGGGAAVLGDPIPVPTGVQLRAGETLRISYSDGVVVHNAVTAACTATSSVTGPRKVNNTASADHTYGLGSGCRDSTTVVALLDSWAPPLWHQRDFEQMTVRPKTTMYWGTVKGCVNTSAKTWHAQNAVGSSIISLSADKSLACNPG
jgi:hypothetical protein